MRIVFVFGQVPVELGAYQSEAFALRLQTLAEFIDTIGVSEAQQRLGGGGGDGSVDARLPYLAQHRLFEQIPELRADICTPDYCHLQLPAVSGGVDDDDASAEGGGRDDDDDDDDEVVVHAWIGPAHTVSTLHWDAPHNLLAQVRGRKVCM